MCDDGCATGRVLDDLLPIIQMEADSFGFSLEVSLLLLLIFTRVELSLLFLF